MRRRLTFKDGMIRILESILLIPLALIGAILLVPFVMLGLLISLPATIIDDIWELDL